MPYLRLNGFDITKYIDMEGCSWSENDLDAPGSGRTLDGLMHRSKVAEKRRADIKLVPVKSSVLNSILPVLRNQYFTVTTDLFPGIGALTLEMYCSTRKGGVRLIDTQGVVWHKDVSFNIIQR